MSVYLCSALTPMRGLDPIAALIIFVISIVGLFIWKKLNPHKKMFKKIEWKHFVQELHDSIPLKTFKHWLLFISICVILFIVLLILENII